MEWQVIMAAQGGDTSADLGPTILGKARNVARSVLIPYVLRLAFCPLS